MRSFQKFMVCCSPCCSSENEVTARSDHMRKMKNQLTQKFLRSFSSITNMGDLTSKEGYENLRKAVKQMKAVSYPNLTEIINAFSWVDGSERPYALNLILRGVFYPFGIRKLRASSCQMAELMCDWANTDGAQVIGFQTKFKLKIFRF